MVKIDVSGEYPSEIIDDGTGEPGANFDGVDVKGWYLVKGQFEKVQEEAEK